MEFATLFKQLSGNAPFPWQTVLFHRLTTHSPVFDRFLPEKDRSNAVTPKSGTVYLVCTSAGEVGIDISADAAPAGMRLIRTASAPPVLRRLRQARCNVAAAGRAFTAGCRVRA